ncbi:MAG: NUDIX hydrolase [Candidatus Hatepunaea meridiana]|nr:NUDIX hydrolase [Candidatus Hatepunaea meridiana]
MTKKTWPPITPLLTVDAIIRTPAGIVLIKRKNPPYGWALPGGFVDVGETVEEAAVREAEEETGLKICNLWLVGVYSDPKRDPRFHTVSIVFGAIADGIPHGADDAVEAIAFKNDQFPNPIVFDHQCIIEDFLRLENDSHNREHKEK